MNRDTVDQGAGDFLVERRGAHVLIRRIGEADAQAGPIGWPEPVDGHVFVLVSPGAAKDGSLITALPALLHRSVVAKDVEAVRIALPGLGRDPFVPQALADALDIEIFAPDGAFIAEPGALLYAGHGTGGTGWLRFRPGAPACPGGRRYPVPAWETAIPATPFGVPGAIVEPVPAGLLVRRPDASSPALGDVAFSVPADSSVAKIVVGGEGAAPAAGLVSIVVGRLSLVPTRLVPLSTTTSTHAWLSEFAKSLSRDVVVEIPPTDVKKRYRPFVAKLLQRADGGQKVLEAVVPPRGWQRRDAFGYRRGQVMADVVPSGLVLRTGAGASVASAAPFDPEGWTLYLGTAGDPIGPELLSGAEALLGELAPETRKVARLELLGLLDDKTRNLIDRTPAIATRAGPPAGTKRAEPVQRQEEQVRPSAPVAAPQAAEGEAVRPVAEAPSPQGAPVMPAALMVSSAPVPTMSGSTPTATAHEAVAGVPQVPPAPAVPMSVTRQEIPAETEQKELPEAASVAAARSEDSAPAPMPVVEETRTEVLAHAAVGAREPVAPSESRVVPGTALVVADRASTAAEQTRFTAAAGDEYGEALATVNAALATWPSMRGQTDSGVKADYVAVCLYLGRGRGGFGDLNTAVRGGVAGEIDGQVSCLASGLRRLPTHRRAVLRQSKDAQGLEGTIAPGSILTEPGFLVGSMDLDVTVPDADLDVLIWPASARRTSELLIGQPVNEVVFFAGARFKALALRATEPVDGEPGDEPTAPRVAALFRELAPDETVAASGELDEHDLAVLAKLDRALERRRRGALRLIEEPGLRGRMTSSLYEWHEDVSSSPAKGQTVTLAS
ncbi:hypothetical protein [Amycolatopsis decaplanina]|uniref:Uncharacterized protein n=1 Tax=Amycolatopsis decaplanina DSM 44594 TaxID=1284240 RepID=M2X1P2_9PSEU|nr:hypothetical protein [Amycolatopsis decaplanina]EME54941.1 hypothetical protein H074_25562 [Amycolatopsis decaplanina DSM 44594]